MKMNRWALLVLVVLMLFCHVNAQAKSGDVVIKANTLYWGQYKAHKELIAVAPPASALTSGFLPQELPFNGVTGVLIRFQRPGDPFFNQDGGIEAGRIESLRPLLSARMRFDMLPILVLFDPAADCRLASADAYAYAVENVMRAVSSDYWFLPCVTDQADAPGWTAASPAMEPMALVQQAASVIRATSQTQLIAGGAASHAVNLELFRQGGVNVIMRRVETYSHDALDGLDAMPVIDVIAPEAMPEEQGVKGAVRAVYTKPCYGFVMDFCNKPDGLDLYDSTIALLGTTVAQDQIERTGARPIDPADTASLEPGEKEEGFVSLFNGYDLAGWVPLTEPDDFVVKDGVVTLEKRTGGWLRSWESYQDFSLRAEYNIADKGNSGIYLRSPLAGRQSRLGFEFQIMGEPTDAPPTPSSTGSLYEINPPASNQIKPGEWNQVEIACVGGEIRVRWNSVDVHNLNYDDHEALRGRPRRGYIGLQDHHNPVQFRKLRIKRIK